MDRTADLDGIQENTTTHQKNQSDFWNGTDVLYQASDRAFTNISLGLGSCCTIINITIMFLLLRHRRCIDGTGFWQQLVFLCSSDILSGISIAFPPLGYLFHNIHVDIYYSFCTFGIILLSLSITLSGGNCCVISIYRYVLLRYIDQPTTIWHKYASSLMLLCNGLLCILTAGTSVLVVTILYGFQYKEFCDNVDMAGQNEYKSVYVMGTIITLTLFLIGTNVFTVLSVVKLRMTHSVDTAHTPSLNIIKRNRYATVTFIAIVFVLNLTSIPTLLFLFLSRNEGVRISADTTEVMSRVLCMNSLLNPLIYSLRSTNFRTAVWNDLKGVLSRVRCTRDDVA